ncbi:MAG: hypothetical protein GY811_02675 [Myxococcales bacterium]|nr:hypothetical protein [Myxococcales bacterium]
MKHQLFASPLLISLALAGGCTDEVGTAQVPIEESEQPEKLDLLFIVDNSASMREEQLAMNSSVDELVNQLALAPNGLPDLHIGVLSTNMGTGGFPINGCLGQGDDGALQPGNSSCNGPADAYVTDGYDSEGLHVTNYSGSLDEAVACMASLGVNGCGFEQPLAAMQRGLESLVADGTFVRDDAHLAVVILTDEDDCSASDANIFDTDPVHDAIDSALGPLSSFRCSEFGLQCDGAPLGRTPGTYTDCEPLAAGSPYLVHPDDYVSYLTGLKGSSSDVTVAVIAGDPTGATVTADNFGARLENSCSSASGGAQPAHRLAYFAEQFPTHLVTSICNPDLGDAMSNAGIAMREGLTPEDEMQSEEEEEEKQGEEEGSDRSGCSTSGSTSPTLAGLWLLAVLAMRRKSAGASHR